jgi:ribosome maturation factor RimP
VHVAAIVERVAALVEPLLAEPPLSGGPDGGPPASLYDVEYEGGVLRIVLDRPGGVDVALLADATRRISAALDEADPIESAYTLEVSSPGIERRLRTSAHFAAAVGETVRIKLRPGVEGDRRVAGVVRSVDGDEVLVDTDDGPRSLRVQDVSRANVHKDWTPPPKPGARRATGARDDRTDHTE